MDLYQKTPHPSQSARVAQGSGNYCRIAPAPVPTPQAPFSDSNRRMQPHMTPRSSLSSAGSFPSPRYTGTPASSISYGSSDSNGSMRPVSHQYSDTNTPMTTSFFVDEPYNNEVEPHLLRSSTWPSASSHSTAQPLPLGTQPRRSSSMPCPQRPVPSSTLPFQRSVIDQVAAHNANSHSLEKPDEKGHKRQCDQCNFEPQGKNQDSVLKRHKKSHQMGKITCKYCGQTFSRGRKDNLKAHQRGNACKNNQKAHKGSSFEQRAEQSVPSTPAPSRYGATPPDGSVARCPYDVDAGPDDVVAGSDGAAEGDVFAECESQYAESAEAFKQMKPSQSQLWDEELPSWGNTDCMPCSWYHD